MAKLSGPMFSMEAHGSIGKTLSFVRGKRTPYVKKHFTPKNPNSTAQIGIRCMAKFLTQYWAELSDEDKASFEELAAAWTTSPYHAWLTLNSRRWANHELPIFNTENTGGAISTHPSCGGSYFHGKWSVRPSIDATSNFPIIAEVCISKDSGFTPSRQTARHIISEYDMDDEDCEFYYSWYPPDEDTYYFRARFGYANGDASEWDT